MKRITLLIMSGSLWLLALVSIHAQNPPADELAKSNAIPTLPILAIPNVTFGSSTSATLVVSNTVPPPITNAQPMITNVVPVITNTTPVITNVAPPPITNTMPMVTNAAPAITNTLPVVTNVFYTGTNYGPSIYPPNPLPKKPWWRRLWDWL